MNDLLRRQLEPPDDGRAFTEAVLLRAAGALHRRRAAHEGAVALPWTALAAWARPWIIAALVALALVMALPGLEGAGSQAATPTLTADLVGASTGTAYVLAETLGN
jgi:hypothetical protein